MTYKMRTPFLFLNWLFLLSILFLTGCQSEVVELKFPNGVFKLNHSTVQSAELGHSIYGTDLYNIQIKLKDEAAQQLRKLSSESIGKDAHLLLNGQIIQTANVMSQLGSQFLLDRLTKAQAESMMKVLPHMKK